MRVDEARMRVEGAIAMRCCREIGPRGRGVKRVDGEGVVMEPIVKTVKIGGGLKVWLCLVGNWRGW